SQKEQVLEDPRRPGVCPTTAAAFVCWEDQVGSGGMAYPTLAGPVVLGRNPISPLDHCVGFVGHAPCQAALFAAARPQHHGTQRRGHARERAELAPELGAQRMNLRADSLVGLAQLM